MRITLCGSGRFEKEFKEWNKKLTLKGHIVYGLSSYASENEGNKNWFTDHEKLVLDAVHLGKIENSDIVVLINPGSYYGESTARELAFAKVMDKPIFALTDFHFFNDAGTLL